MKRFVALPFALGPPLAGGVGRREGVDETQDLERHIRDKIIAILMTAPGERIMRPRFGAGINRALFENLSPLARTTIEYRIRQSLDRDLGPEAVLEDVLVTFDPPGGVAMIAIDYRRQSDAERSRLEVIL